MNKVFEKAFDFVYPNNIYCSCCGDVMNGTRVHGLCDNCIAEMTWLTKNPFENKLEGFFFDDVISLVLYDGYAQQIVHNLKFHSKPYIARGIGRLMGELLLTHCDERMTFVPVPMFKDKEKVRGYNQAALLAEYAAKASGNLFLPDAIIKIKSTNSMRMARAEDRFTALNGSMVVNRERLDYIENKEIVLVDDVITTGNTANYCSKILKDSGAKKVIILSFAAVDYKGNNEE